MGNGVINIKESEMQSISNHLKKTANDVSLSNSNMGSSFKSFTKVGLLSNGANKISDQMSSISNYINRVGSTVMKQYEEMEHTEKGLKAKADEINIPNDFVTNDTSKDIYMKSGKLEKEDGKKVDANDNTKEEQLEFKECIDYNEKLKNIVKDYEKKNGEIEIKGYKTALSNIKNSDELELIEDIEDSIIEKEMLTNINSEFILKENNINMDELNLNKVILTQMDYGSLKASIYDDKYIVKRTDLRKPE